MSLQKSMFPTIHQLSKKLTLTIFLCVQAACGQLAAKPATLAQPVNLYADRLPNVAAEFVTTRADADHEHGGHDTDEEMVRWRFWRDANRVSTERPELALGELWQRDGKSLIHRKLYHADQRAIEFQDDDLRITETMPSWQKLALLLDPKLLQQLDAADAEWDKGYPVREYHGQLADTEWHVVMRLDLALPALIERRHQQGWERTELLAAHPLDQAPWQPTSTRGYDVIDFADLGDKETDPFVIRVQSQMGHEHHR